MMTAQRLQTFKPIPPRWTHYLACGAILLASAAHAEQVVLVAGGGTGGDGSPAVEARLNSPFGIAFDAQGDLWFVEMEGQRLCHIDKQGKLNVIAGTGEDGNAGDGGPGKAAKFNGMHSLAIGPRDVVYLADTWNNRIRRFDPNTGLVGPYAGSGKKGFAGDGGSAAAADFGGVYCLAFDAKQEQMYVADLDNRRVRAIDMTKGTVSTVAGNGLRGVPLDGTIAVESPLVDPRAAAFDAAGNLYILERSGNALRVVDAEGRIRTVAGTGQKGAFGDGGDARFAMLNGPKHLCIDRAGNVLIADTENHVIRKYLAREGKIVRVAGKGTKGSTGVGGGPLEVQLSQPHGVAFDAVGALYIADSSNHRILKIEP